ncbi:M4 family metallopeptidase [Geodermatophilus sp. YIM 151500]|uniref:M4 family metallopeptidase n=1 Tax=Geodermatophilus sp. YIM 151500 TaxID=2984531 RepID=UPI0021E3712C|nr:M4 family metallopeptidase [Geodermatophilus sp. YIM 151500]MCV2489182.1 M4 family metallopeptidase [Geodermatophilus sp. YIM 151500]
MTTTPAVLSPPAAVCSFIPDYVLRNIAERGGDEERRAALQALATSGTMRSLRVQAEARRSVLPRSAMPELTIALAPPTKERLVRDAKNTMDLRGPIVRAEAGTPSEDKTAEAAFERLGTTWDFFFQVFARNSIDKAGMPIEGVVHYRRNFDNAFWNGTQMVFGDGSGRLFTRLAHSLTVCAHELSHGVVQYDGPLVYQGQSGALNESMADVLGVLVEQWSLGQTVEQADWLVGREILAPGVSGRALRSLAEPGTAYDDDVLGKDPQPGHMDQYVDTDEDNGGVHINSGIPNRAFTLVATRLGGNAWEDAGRIWYASLGHERLLPSAMFRQFARITRYVASTLFGTDSRQVSAVEEAWSGVGVEL